MEEMHSKEDDSAAAKVDTQSAAGETTSANPKASPPPVLSSLGPSTSDTSKTPTAATPRASHTLEDANEEVLKLIRSGNVASADIVGVKAILKEYISLKGKVDKLKSLLGRSAKAQRETKVDMDAAQKRLGQALREIERLNQKLEKLQSRPTHLDLLMDFETNFDKALLSVGQTGGEDTAATPAMDPSMEQESALDTMLLQELGEAKARIEKLETLNNTMMTRSTQLETSTKTVQKERDDASQLTDRLKMELRIAKMEAEHAMRAMQDKAASLEEMQMEIDLVTKASAKANSRAAKGEEIANSLKTDRQRVQEFEAQVQALQEWALASAETKRLMQERCSILENKLKQFQGRPLDDNDAEKVLFKKNGSLVVGAGDKGIMIVPLGQHAGTVDSRFVVLRWKFDFSPPESTIDFNVIKGKCGSAAQQKKAGYLIKDRVITGGAAGETEGAFNIDGACTLLWSNSKSWVRPRTVTYSVEVVSLK